MDINWSKVKTLGDFLKAVMTARRLTERTLSQGAGIAQSGLSNLIQQKAREPDARTLRAIADYLQIDVFILFRLLGYVPPSTEPYGSYRPLALYVAQRFETLPVERQEVLLHVLESLLEDVDSKKEVRRLRSNPDADRRFSGIEQLHGEFITQCGRWYLSQGRFETSAEVLPEDDEEIYPGIRFGDLEDQQRAQLLAFLRHLMRQVYTPDLVSLEDRETLP
jgi:transcriptional regulator with XRE-family HTH domain